MTSDSRGPAAPVARLVGEFHKLPGIGPKTAQRLTYYLVRMPKEEARSLAEAIQAVKDRIVPCSRCYNITEDEPCGICADPRRDESRICVVEEALDVLAALNQDYGKTIIMVTHDPKAAAYASVKHYLEKGLLSVAPE